MPHDSHISDQDSALNDANPFDQISQLEAEQEALVTKSLHALHAEEQESLQKLEDQKAAAVSKEKEAARMEIEGFENEEIPQIIQKQENEAVRLTKVVDEASSQKVPTIAKKLVETLLDPSFIS